MAGVCPNSHYTAECLEGKDALQIYEEPSTGVEHPFVVGLCTCDGEFIMQIFNLIAEAMAVLGKVLCSVVNTVIEVLITTAEAALSAVPGGQFVGSAARVVKAAKTFSENALDAASFFNGYLSGNLCTGDAAAFKLPDNPDEVFKGLVEAPDRLNGEDMTSIGCKKKSGCKRPEDRGSVDVPVKDGDKNNGGSKPTGPTQQPTDKPTETGQPTRTDNPSKPTKTEEPTRTDGSTGTNKSTRTDSSTSTYSSTSTDSSSPITSSSASETTASTATTTSSTSTTTTDGERATDCAPCGSRAIKRAAQEERWGILYGRAGPQCVVDDQDEPDVDDQESCDASSSLEARALGMVLKKEKISLTTPEKLEFGEYAQCALAKREPEIEKYFLFKTDSCKSAEVIQLPDTDPRVKSGSKLYHSEFIVTYPTTRIWAPTDNHILRQPSMYMNRRLCGTSTCG
jgi:hypothetical protein